MPSPPPDGTHWTTENVALLRQGLGLAQIGGWHYDIVNDRLTWSDEVYRIFGIEPGQFRATMQSFEQFVHPGDLEKVRTAYLTALAGGSSYEVIHRIVRADGTVRIVREMSTETRDESGTAVASWGVVQDVTEQQRHQEILAARLRLLQRDDDEPLDLCLRATLDEAEDLTDSCIGFYHFLEPDQVTLSLQTWSTRTLSGMCSATSFERHYPLARAGVWADCVRQRTAIVHNDYAGLRDKRGLPPGHAPVLREIVVPVLRGDQIVAILGVGNKTTDYTDSDVATISLLADLAWDIAERKRSRANRIELERRVLAAQKSESLGVLAGGLAHDFNNLLMVIIGNIELAQLDLPPSSRVHGFLEQVMQSSQRAAELTRQLLAYAGRTLYHFEAMQLNDMLRAHTTMMRMSVPRQQVLHLELTPLPTPVLADAAQLQQIVGHLLANAVEAIGETPGSVTVRTGVQELTAADLVASPIDDKPAPGSFAFFEVVDTGVGMDEAALQRLFDPFFSTKFAGRGLGMPAVFGIVRSHHGAIFANSEVGRGTSVRVLLPLRAEPVEAPIVSSESPARAYGPILLADDEFYVRGVCEVFLQRLGHQVVLAQDGEEALQLFRNNPADYACLLLDLTMPRRDGLSTCREVRALRPDVPIILCSGYPEEEAVQRYGDDGPTGFLQKPYRLQNLRDALERAMAPKAD